MTYIKGFKPKATKRQLQFMNKYGLKYRKNVNKGEAKMLIQNFTKSWSEELKQAEGVDSLHNTEKSQVLQSLKYIANLKVSNEF